MMFVDSENINPKIFMKAHQELAKKFDIKSCNIYGDIKMMPKIYLDNAKLNLSNSCFGVHGKNVADTFIAVDMIKCLYNDNNVDALIIVSEDSDFTPVVKAITDVNKKAVVVTEKDRTIRIFKEFGVNLNHVVNFEVNMPKQEKFVDPTAVELNCTIFIKRNDIITEVPFANGIVLSEFGKIIRNKVDLPKKFRLTALLESCYLKVEDDKVWLMSEEELRKDDI